MQNMTNVWKNRRSATSFERERVVEPGSQPGGRHSERGEDGSRGCAREQLNPSPFDDPTRHEMGRLCQNAGSLASRVVALVAPDNAPPSLGQPARPRKLTRIPDDVMKTCVFLHLHNKLLSKWRKKRGVDRRTM